MKALLSMTLGEMLERNARLYPSNLAVKYFEVKYERTYYDFNNDVDKIARGLLGMGLRKGDHIAVWAMNCPEWIILFFACARIGVVLVTVNTGYKAKELHYILEQSDSKALFLCNDLRGIDSTKIICSICPELKNAKPGKFHSKTLPFLRAVISLDNDYDGMYNWSQIGFFGASITDKEYTARKKSVLPTDVSNILYTSGTTGFPKGVMLTHFNILNNAAIFGYSFGIKRNDKLLAMLPFFHIFAMTLTLVMPLFSGSAIIPLLAYNPVRALHAIEYEKISIMPAVPTMFMGIIQHIDFEKYNISSLRSGLVGATLVPPAIYMTILNKLKLKNLVNAYGQTECSPAITIPPVDAPLEKKMKSVGKVLKFSEIKIIDPETKETVAPDVNGEICVRGCNVMKGYYKMPEATAETIDRDGWLHTGDIGVVDADGYYNITGRLKDMIIRGGENIFPKELEDLIITHPAVAEVQVVAVPSERYGEEVFAYIIPRKNAIVTEKEIKKYVSDKMAAFKVPAYVAFINEMPMNASGKVLKYVLKEMAIERLGIKTESAPKNDKN